ncbi:hypothetical protein GGS23DRAFT_10714 [Durotheca rogersii]|uniref:uncharacterized protein n=1 Tax=Durotheca rogersii TaxID=419775 RepID=UPI00221F4CC7|nr:uncharacterized protein GGS23DRAFT_10714 [Durotheca rogersii]KAI5868088.1 hypothetical protein GGS23DRAFT_10714 [Durotheca rogersii]
MAPKSFAIQRSAAILNIVIYRLVYEESVSARQWSWLTTTRRSCAKGGCRGSDKGYHARVLLSVQGSSFWLLVRGEAVCSMCACAICACASWYCTRDENMSDWKPHWRFSETATRSQQPSQSAESLSGAGACWRIHTQGRQPKHTASEDKVEAPRATKLREANSTHARHSTTYMYQVDSASDVV